MPAASTPPFSVRIRHEARILYTLLDAADSAGKIAGTLSEAPWRESNVRVRAGASFEGEAERFHDLMVTLESSGVLAGTWIEERWRSLQSRIQRHTV